MKDETSDAHPKVQEIRELSVWSEGHVWVSPEQHGTITAVFKNQIDWIPLNLGSVRPTQGRTLCIAQVLHYSCALVALAPLESCFALLLFVQSTFNPPSRSFLGTFENSANNLRVMGGEN